LRAVDIQANPGRLGDAKPRDWVKRIQLAGLPTLQLVQGESVSPKTQEVSMVRIRSVLSHSTQALVEGALVSLLVVGLMAGTAFAAKPTQSSGGSGSCWANPSPVAVGADYVLTGTGLGAYAIVNVLISDSVGTTSWNLQADASGRTSVTWHSYWTGTSSVKFMKSSRHSSSVVASCTFAVN
jgi:hypothetical protein